MAIASSTSLGSAKTGLTETRAICPSLFTVSSSSGAAIATVRTLLKM